MSVGRYFTLKLDVKPDTAAGWLAKSKGMHASATKSENAPMYTTIAPLLQQLNTNISGLDSAQALAANGGKDAIKARDAKWSDLTKSTHAFVAGVQGLCDAATDPEHAKQIAAGAGLAGKDKPKRTKPDFYGKVLGNGAVHLYAKRPGKKGARVFYEWQISKDGGATWISLPGTNDANTLVEGLTPGTVHFRHRTIVKNTPSDWSNEIPVIVR
jgi:hypothetical protein